MQGQVREDCTRIYTRSSQNDLRKIIQGHLGTYWGISAGSPQNLLTRTMDLLTGFNQDLHHIFAQGPLQNFGQDLHVLRTAKTAPSNSRKTVMERPAVIRSPYQNLRESAQFSIIQHGGVIFASRHGESEPTRAKCQEGCTSDIQIRTAPQRERGLH